MATYNFAAVADAVIAFKKGITLQQGRALRDNPLAMFEGAAGAPRLQLAALERLSAGDAVRAELGGTVSRDDNASLSVSRSVGIIQFGSFRVVLSHAGTASGRQISISRTRAGVTTTVLASTATSPTTIDLDCIPGDHFRFAATGSTGASGGNLSVNASIRTDNNDLWPGEGLWGEIIGNRAAPT